MIAGFDYGTSNCALSTFSLNTTSAVPLDDNSHYLPSLVYAECREAIVEFVAKHIPPAEQAQYQLNRAPLLRLASKFRAENGITDDESILHFGAKAMKEYVYTPTEGFFAKSPKSFLGSGGLSDAHISFFEDIVTAMMLHVNNRSQQHIGDDITDVVIGRPVNFSNLDAEAGNRQAINILTAAAKRSGYKNVEFLYEPLAAGLAFEKNLQADKLVLVLDIGGGTTDCSMMHMGPSFCDKKDRTADFLAHCGIRIGGNDLDIQLAAKAFMPLMGMNCSIKDNLPMPTQYYWDAIRINDVNAQARCYSADNIRKVQELAKTVSEPALYSRFTHMLTHKKNFSVIKSSEQAKIALSSNAQYTASLDSIESELATVIHQRDLEEAVEKPLQLIMQLLAQSVSQAGKSPDLVFITGGSGQSPIIRAAVNAYFGDIDIVDGDHFGSVVTGLAQWAGDIYK